MARASTWDTFSHQLPTNISETEHADTITFPSSFTNKGQSLRTLVSFLDMKSFWSSGISFWEDK